MSSTARAWRRPAPSSGGTIPKGHRRYVALLNRGLYNFAARKRVRFDLAHKRFFFEALTPDNTAPPKPYVGLLLLVSGRTPKAEVRESAHRY